MMSTKFNRIAGWGTLMCVLFFSLPAFSETEPLSAIKGKVITEDGVPAAYIAVQIKEKNRGVLTNEKGEFLFKRMQPGHYTLQVMLMGFKTLTKEVDVVQDEILNVTLQLEASDKQLQEVIISGARNKYKTDSLSLLVNNLLDDRQLLTSASLDTKPANDPTGFYTYIVEARRNFRTTITYRF